MLTPNHLVRIARLLLVPLVAMIAMTVTAQPHVTAILCYFAVAMMMVAWPRVRAADLAASALVMLVLLCFADAARAGLAAVLRLALGTAAIGAAVLPFKLSRIRRLAAQNGYAPLLERRAKDRHGRRASASPVAPASADGIARPLLLPPST